MRIFASAIQEMSLASRRLCRARAFTGAAVMTLALGMAGTTVVFALVQGVLLRTLPVHEQDRLIVAWKEARTAGSAHYPFGDTEIEAVAAASHLLESAAGVTRNGVRRSVLAEHGVSSYANVALVTGGFFDVLGVRPILGRALAPGDERDGVEHVVVISSRLWQRRYGRSQDVIGRPIELGEQRFRIVGVMPPDLDYPSGVEIWRPTSSVPTSGPFGNAARREVDLIGRLRPGVTLGQATGEIVALSERLDVDAPATAMRGLVPVVSSFEDVVVGDVRPAMLVLFGAVGLVLFLAGANVANLFLMRGEAERGALAIRVALGAGRGRILRQVLAESLMVALLAGVAGIAVTWWSLPALVTLVPDGLPRVESVRVDATVIAFSIAVVFVTAFLAGLPPALLSIRGDLVSQVQSGGRGAIGAATTRGRRMLVVAQVALAVTIVAAAGLLIRSVLRLQSIDLGLPADRLVLIELHLPSATYAQRPRHAQFLDDAIVQLEALPAITAATPVNVSPFSGQGWDVPRFTAEGQSLDQARSNPSLNLESIHPNYFETFDVPLLRGRAFSTADRAGAADVAIVSEDVAARTWPGDNPIGKRLKMGAPDAPGQWYTVVGVAAHTRYRTVTGPRPTLYLPAAQFQMTATMLVVRSAASLDLISTLARDRIGQVDAGVQVMRVAPFTEMLDRPLARPRFNAFLLSVFAIAALLLSTVGLYAVMAAFVRQRDREIAVRLAVGATPTRVRHFVLAETVRLAGVGAAIGLAAAVAGSRFLRGLLYEVEPLDRLTMVSAALLLMAAAVAASYVPVRRATRVDTAAMLRSQ